MAIDFPASPTDGQTFVPPGTSTLYRYSAASTAWVSQGASAPSGVGDFCTLQAGPFTLSTSVAVATSMPVISGNLGNWFVPATGRYTPPAGRYFIYARMLGTNASAVTTVSLNIRKNGTQVDGCNSTVAAGYWATVITEVTLDANGSDYFEVTTTGTATTNGYNLVFGAYPLTGMLAPPTIGTGGAGDVSVASAAYSSALTASADTVIAMSTVLSGNSGSWWNTSTNRYTPPVGRYSIQVSGNANFGTTLGTTVMRLRKNGTAIASISGSGAVGYQAAMPIDVNVDASGADYFDVVMNPNVAGVQGLAIFSAYPLTGMTGPAGPAGTGGGVIAVGDTAPASPADSTLWFRSDIGRLFVRYNDGNTTQWVPTDPAIAPATQPMPGVLTLYSETILSANAATVDVTFPANCRRVEIEFSVETVSSVLIGLTLMAGATQLSSWNTQALYGTVATAGASNAAAQGSLGLITGTVASGFAKVFKQGGAGTATNMIANNYGTSANMLTQQMVGAHATAYNTITGARMIAAANFTAGSYMRAYVVV